MDDVRLPTPKIAEHAEPHRQNPVLPSNPIHPNSSVAERLPKRTNRIQTCDGRAIAAACDHQIVNQPLEPADLQTLDHVQNAGLGPMGP